MSIDLHQEYIQTTIKRSDGFTYDLTPYLLADPPLRIIDSLSSEKNRCTFGLVDCPWKPHWGDKITVKQGDQLLFGGSLRENATAERLAPTVIAYYVECPGYAYLLHRKQVIEAYSSTTDVAIMQDLISNYADGFIDAVQTGGTVTIDYMPLNYVSLPEAFNRVIQYSGKYYYVTPDRQIEYYSKSQREALTAVNVIKCGDGYHMYRELKHVGGNIQRLATRVRVRANRQKPSATTERHICHYDSNGNDNTIQLLYKPIPGEITVSRVSPSKTYTLSTDLVDAIPGELVINYDLGKIREGTGTLVFGTSDAVIEVEYKYEEPIEMFREDATAQTNIAAYEGDDGKHDDLIIARDIIDSSAALAIADAKLEQFSNPEEGGTITCWWKYARAGDILKLKDDFYDVDDSFLVQEVESTRVAPGLLEHKITYGKYYQIPNLFAQLRDLKRGLDQIVRFKSNRKALTS
jgi:hypothetical protein